MGDLVLHLGEMTPPLTMDVGGSADPYSMGLVDLALPLT